MKERRYKDDWTVEVSLNEKTGRDKRVPVYSGSWFQLDEAAKRVHSNLTWGLIPWLAFFTSLMVWFLLDYAGSRAIAVVLPASVSLFPLLYWALGVAVSFRCKARMTRLQKAKGFTRILHSSIGCLLCTGAALAANLVFALGEGILMTEWPGLLLLLLAVMAAAIAFQHYRWLEHHITELHGGELT